MEINKIEKEIYLSDKLKLLINRNDFDDLGSIIEIKCPYNSFKDFILTFILYDSNGMVIPPNKLIMLTNEKNITFDNSLIFFPTKIRHNNENLNNLSNNPKSNYEVNDFLSEDCYFTLKFLNKEIIYIKILLLRKNNFQYNSNVSATNFIKRNKSALQNTIPVNNLTNLNQIVVNNEDYKEFNIYSIECLNMNLIENDFEKSFQKIKSNENQDRKLIYTCNANEDKYSNQFDRKDQFNIILDELNKVNSSLIAEKEIVEKKKKEIKIREENINTLIL